MHSMKSSAPVIREGLQLCNHSETVVRVTPVIREGRGMNHDETVLRAFGA